LQKEEQREEFELSTMTSYVLAQLANGNSFLQGQKGDMIVAGGVSNYTYGHTIMYELLPFFKELKDNDCFWNNSNIICFSQSEQQNNVDITILNCNTLEIKEITTKEWRWQNDR